MSGSYSGEWVYEITKMWSNKKDILFKVLQMFNWVQQQQNEINICELHMAQQLYVIKIFKSMYSNYLLKMFQMVV
jgi:hypothetical protein